MDKQKMIGILNQKIMTYRKTESVVGAILDKPPEGLTLTTINKCLLKLLTTNNTQDE